MPGLRAINASRCHERGALCGRADLRNHRFKRLDAIGDWKNSPTSPLVSSAPPPASARLSARPTATRPVTASGAPSTRSASRNTDTEPQEAFPSLSRTRHRLHRCLQARRGMGLGTGAGYRGLDRPEWCCEGGISPASFTSGSRAARFRTPAGKPLRWRIRPIYRRISCASASITKFGHVDQVQRRHCRISAAIFGGRPAHHGSSRRCAHAGYDTFRNRTASPRAQAQSCDPSRDKTTRGQITSDFQKFKVKPRKSKIFRLTRRANHLRIRPSHPMRGADRDRHERAVGCGGRDGGR